MSYNLGWIEYITFIKKLYILQHLAFVHLAIDGHIDVNRIGSASWNFSQNPLRAIDVAYYKMRTLHPLICGLMRKRIYIYVNSRIPLL